ncbi:MAG: redoxin domain-containing protein [Bacteroidales bacterium]|nr:redoxin domain-containing protein [Bacteroidales bacterium]
MKILKTSLVLLFIGINFVAQSQIKVYNFDQLEPLLHQENDTTYVINFWATWCLPCVKELPAFDKFNRENQSRKFKMLLVSLDFGKDVIKKLEEYKLKHNLSPEIVLLDDPDANAWIPKIDKEWSGAIPATLIYRNKKWQFYGHSFTYDELKKEIEKFIN